jgi:hypothetical protein
MNSLGGEAAMRNPYKNAMMAKYLYDAAGGISPWYGTKYVTAAHGDGWGHRAPEWGGWHQRGTEFTARRPTIIGVGEGGAERVKVTPASKDAGSGTIQLSIHVDKIVNNEEGDIERILEREFKALARDLRNQVGGRDDGEM